MQAMERLHYVDHLRVAAFGVLLVYHSSVAFFPDMQWLIESDEKSELLSTLMNFPRAWRLALLFFVSGMGTWFAFRSNTGFGFLKERLVRLLVPLIFAMCVIVVPQVWFERMYEEGYEGSLLTFWVGRYFTEGKYPAGNFTWAHMWFVGYLLAMTMVAYPLFRLLERPRAQGLGEWFERLAGRWIYFFFLVPVALNLVLTPLFPRQTNSLYNDGAWFAVWASWFYFGFMVARHHRRVIQSIVERRWTSFSLAVAITICLYRYSWARPGVASYEQVWFVDVGMTFALAWTMILTLTGFAAVYLNRKSALISWLNDRIFTLYMVHQTFVVWVLYHVLPLAFGVWATFFVVLFSTTLFSLMFAAVVYKLPWPLRSLVGLGREGGPQRYGDYAMNVHGFRHIRLPSWRYGSAR